MLNQRFKAGSFGPAFFLETELTSGPDGTVINTVNNLIKAGHLVREDAYTRKKVTAPTG